MGQPNKWDESGMGRDESGALGTNRANLGTNQRRERGVGGWLRGSKQSPVNGTFAGMSRPRGLVPPAAPSFGLLT